jgi:hypothetical protein
MPDNELSIAISDVLNDLKKSVDDGLVILRMPDGSLSVSSDPLAAFRLLRRSDDMHTSLRSIIIDACERSEAIGTGSTRYLIRILSNMIQMSLEGIENSSIRDNTRSIIDGIPLIASYPSQASIDACIQYMIPDTAAMVLEAIKLAGSECKIFIEPSTTGLNVIERINGHTFTVASDATFLKFGKWYASGVKCLIIDGLIERVAEIDSLLQQCNKTKRAMIIFARGFSNDVLATLRVNYARKTLNVIPVTVEFDLETANVLLDIATVVGCDVISSLKGELISTISFDKLPIVQSITCTGAVTTIITDNSTTATQIHLRNLIERRNAESIPSMKKIIDKRIRSLSSTTVVMKIIDSGPRGNKTMHDVDTGLKMVRNILQYGSVTFESIKQLTDCSQILDGVIDADTICPSLVLGSALYHALATYESLVSAAMFLNN